jgi:hypothetical protein
MSSRQERGIVCGLAVAIVLGAGSFAAIRAQERDRPRGSAEKGRASAAERASGVIVVVEPISNDNSKLGSERSGSRRLTINTAAVWRDWARDQATDRPTDSPKKAAEKGANSIATKGEPEDPDTLVTIDIGPSTKVETRFRASSDETSKGARTSAEAREGRQDPAEKTKPRSRDSGMAPRFAADDLKPGLFIEVDFRRASGQNVASTLAVIRPVGGPETPAGQ